jgi:hypothetical protein
MASRSGLTLCVITKNEATNLPGCFASVQGVVDAIVVVDTGSSDATVAIARAAGATVVEFPWIDDFAAARNAALPYVTTEFMLVLDADDRLAPGAAEALRAALADPKLDCGLLPQHDADRVDATPEQVLRMPSTLVPRLLRKTADLAWRGRVHESIGDWISARRERAAFVDAPILHYGSVPLVRERLQKAERNVRLLRLRVAEEPESPIPPSLLGEELLNAGQAEEARAHFVAAWGLLQRAWEPPDGGPQRTFPPPIRVLQRYFAIKLEEDDFEGASDAVAKVIDWVGDEHPVVRFLRSRVEELAGDASDGDARREWLMRALRGYRTCAQSHGLAYTEPVPPTVTGLAACIRLSVVLLKLNEAGHARAVAEGAIEQHGDHAELRCVLAEAALLQGAPARALSVLGHDPGRTPVDVPDAWGLAADAFLQSGDRTRAAVAARRAADADSWREPHRLVRFLVIAEVLN